MSPEESRARMREVLATAARWWAGEAEVARAYFAAPHTLEDDLRWLRAQAFKEAYPILQLPAATRGALFAGGRLADADIDPARARALEDELRHFRLITGLLADLTGAPVSLASLAQLPEDGRLQALRRTLAAAGGELARAVVGFTEGGGGAMYAVLAALGADARQRSIADVFAVILADEIRHGPMQIHAIAEVARDGRDWDTAVGLVATISRQRLRMRNEMFGEPLPATRLLEIDAGRIEPWPCPITV